jgi:hypothetical protein
MEERRCKAKQNFILSKMQTTTTTTTNKQTSKQTNKQTETNQ